MKMLGYDIRPVHAVYATVLAALASIAPGCGGSKDSFEYENRATRRAYEAVQKNMELHGRLREPGKWSAVLLKAANHDGNMANPLKLADLQWLIEAELNQGDRIYGWTDKNGSVEGAPVESSR